MEEPPCSECEDTEACDTCQKRVLRFMAAQQYGRRQLEQLELPSRLKVDPRHAFHLRWSGILLGVLLVFGVILLLIAMSR